MASQSSLLDIIDTTTILSLLSTLAILGAAYILSIASLSPTSSAKTRFLFIWHAFDALIHFILEGSFLYNCFYAYTVREPPNSSSGSAFLDSVLGATGSSIATPVSEFLAPGVHFLDRPDRVYGAAYGASPFSALWREYAKADGRWAGTDLTVVSLELLTVFLGGPIAVWICWCLAASSKGSVGGGGGGSGRGGKGKGKGKARAGGGGAAAAATKGREWFWMVLLATAELYGGFMTFMPEWLSGSPNLDTSNFMYTWVYLFFFNTLWVWVPLWILYEAYGTINDALASSAIARDVRKTS